MQLLLMITYIGSRGVEGNFTNLASSRSFITFLTLRIQRLKDLWLIARVCSSPTIRW